MDEGIDILLKTKNGMNCLHIAATYGHLNLCKTLLNKHKFDVHMNDNKGFTGLHFSAKNGNYELVKFFVDKGTDILLKTKNGTKCLHLAAKNGYLNLCRTLVNIHVFDVQIPDNKGFIVFQHPTQNKAYELVTFFVDQTIDSLLKTKPGKN